MFRLVSISRPRKDIFDSIHFSADACRSISASLLAMSNDLIYQAVLFGLISIHNSVALDVSLDQIISLTRMPRQDLAGELTHPHQLFGMNAYVAGLSRDAAYRGLMDEYAR